MNIFYKKQHWISICFVIKSILLVLVPCSAQPGSPDLTFNPTDTGAVSFGFSTTNGTVSDVRCMISLQSGNILVGGNHLVYNRYPTRHITRLTQQGVIDQGFTTGTGFQLQTGPATFTNGVIYTLLELPDGKILAGGQFNLYRGQPAGGIIRLMPNGEPDPTFVTGTGANNIVHALKLMPGGKVLVGGAFTEYNGTTYGRLVMLNSNGTVDTDFNDGGTGANSAVFAIDTLSTGEIIIGGSFSSFNGDSKSRLAKLEKDGTLIPGFPVVNAPNGNVHTIVAEADDKIMVAGAFSIFAGVSGSIRRILGNGEADLSFIGTTTANSGTEILIPYGPYHYFAGGSFTLYEGEAVNRLVLIKKADGSRETNWNPNNIGAAGGGTIRAVTANYPQGLAVGGSFIIISNANTGNIFGLTHEGNLNGSFNAGHGVYAATVGIAAQQQTATNRILRMLQQPDGKVLVAGQFSRYFGHVSRCIVRIMPDGSPDLSFSASLPGADGEITDLALQADGKIIIVGRFGRINGERRDRVARLHADGSLDDTFIPDNWLPPASGTISLSATAIAPDGKIYVAGAFTSYFTSGSFSTVYKRLIRLQSNGKLDSSFVPANISAGNINSLLVQANGSIIAGGNLLSISNNTGKGNLLKFLSDGSLDETFNNGIQTVPSGNTVNRLKYNKDSTKIYVAGLFSTYGGISAQGLTRINLDGVRDVTFGSPSLNNIQDVEELPDGRLLAAGAVMIAATPNGILVGNQPGVARISATGVFDTAFANGAYRARGVAFNENLNAASTVYACVLTGNGLIIGGNFLLYGEVARTTIAAINPGEIPTPVTWQHFDATPKGNTVLLQWSTAQEQHNSGFSIERSTDGSTFASIGFVAAQNGGNASHQQHYHFTDQKPANTTNYYRIKQIDFDGQFSFSGVRKVTFGKAGTLSLFPNPMHTQATIQFTANTYTSFTMYDILGKAVQQATINTGQTTLSLQRNNLPPGIYYMHLHSHSGQTNLLKLVIQ